MQVELWADVVCSWCGIANRRVQEAIAAFEHGDGVRLTHRSFRLLLDRPEGESISFIELGRSMGMGDAQTRAAARQVEQVAAADGIVEYHVGDNRVGNTTLAHEFLAYASEQGQHDAAWDLLFEAHFADRAPLWTIQDLQAFAMPLGLDPEAAGRALVERRHRAQVVADHEQAVAFGASGVPFLVIDRRYGISGAQPVAQIVATLERAWHERAGVAV